MKFSSPSTLMALSAVAVTATPVALAPRATPTIYTCGDSTMAKLGANNGETDGWGQYLGNYTTATVVNKAIAGRSARSYWEEGRFAAVTELLKEGDIVIIEFGHNDGGSPETNDNGRSDCPGTGEETCTSSADGSTVYTFVYYIAEAAKAMVAKGASVVLSSQTPNNPWETGSFVYSAPRFVGYQKTTAALFSSGVTFVDHFNAVDQMYKKLGDSVVTAYFPSDHTHTSPTAADMVAKAFAQAIATKENGTTSLVDYIISDVPSVY
ncbi:Rhamnogalacturonan acetylesterase [Cytospora mali]|uniref:Rhamnogalacturonan acetylesterase n=1 Tax=Cytospora mali TaxID=578113 RepID=A0A194W725_CYTMA|nr:Rhamnogalacturonan acetylesterase [Valsa mali]